MGSFCTVMAWVAIGWIVGDKLYNAIKNRKSKGVC